MHISRGTVGERTERGQVGCSDDFSAPRRMVGRVSSPRCCPATTANPEPPVPLSYQPLHELGGPTARDQNKAK